MRIIDVVQGTPEWEYARLGIPTASQADRILTPRQLRPASAQREYLHQLLAEWLVGHPIDWGQASPWADRGREMEAEARMAYELEMGAEVQTVGLIVTDDGLFGGSPDGLVGLDGGLEIKCPGIHTHIGYLLEPSTLAERYRGQTQALLWLTGREWWDLWAYHPELPPVRVRVQPDDAWRTAWEPTLASFLDQLLAGRDRLREYRRGEPEHAEEEVPAVVPGDLTSLLPEPVIPSAQEAGR